MNRLWRLMEHLDKEYFWWLPAITVAYFCAHAVWWFMKELNLLT